jgi:hypothetical protein
MAKACCATSVGRRCTLIGAFRLNEDIAHRATFKNKGGFGRSLAYELTDGEESSVCFEHFTEIVDYLYHPGLQQNLNGFNRKTLLTDLASFLDHTGRAKDMNEVFREASKTAIDNLMSDMAAEVTLVSPGLGVATPRPKRRCATTPEPMTRDMSTQTADDEVEHPLVELLHRVIKRTPDKPGSLIREDTHMYAFFHTNLRAILIADRDTGLPARLKSCSASSSSTLASLVGQFATLCTASASSVSDAHIAATGPLRSAARFQVGHLGPYCRNSGRVRLATCSS